MYRRVVHNILLSEYVYYLFQRVVHKTIYRSKTTSKTNNFVLEKIFYMAQACVRESVRTRGMGLCNHCMYT